MKDKIYDTLREKLITDKRCYPTLSDKMQRFVQIGLTPYDGNEDFLMPP